MKKRLIAIAILVVTIAVFSAAATAYPQYWGCFERQADGQCVVTVNVDNKFNATDQRVIREVLAEFDSSEYIAIREASGKADVSINQGCLQGTCGFWTDPRTRKVYITKGWSYENYCCDSHDGMRGVFCVELMHAIVTPSYPPRLQPSCMNGTSGHLGVEDFQDLQAYATWGPVLP